MPVEGKKPEGGHPVAREETPLATAPKVETFPAPLAYRRRPTRAVWVGGVGIGGAHPIRVQSMLTANTWDVPAVLAEMRGLVAAGSEIVRLTVPAQRDLEAMPAIRQGMAETGLSVPLVADIHFNPRLALGVVPFVEKVRINPGNYVDSKRFSVREYTDAEYAEELKRIAGALDPLVEALRAHGRSLRIGVNHGSLSDRILNRHGDTPEGMVECAMEYLRLLAAAGYHDIIVSMKSSNPLVVIQAYRLLVLRMEGEGMDYPLHLGVTEAGNGAEGRIKSAVGIGALLADGLGDTIRVSLTEPAANEIPAARELLAALAADPAEQGQPPAGRPASLPLPIGFTRRPTLGVPLETEGGQRLTAGGDAPVRFLALASEGRLAPRGKLPGDGGFDAVLSAGAGQTPPGSPGLHLVRDARPLYPLRRLVRDSLDSPGMPMGILLPSLEAGALPLGLAAEVGSLAADGLLDALVCPGTDPDSPSAQFCRILLQAARLRAYRAEYISCPSCGRTLFDLEETTARIQARTSHLKGVKIGVMGCIVNGPGEMADADFGYVGGAPDRINLYKGQTCVERGVPASQAVDRLVDLIKAHGAWVEPPA